MSKIYGHIDLLIYSNLLLAFVVLYLSLRVRDLNKRVNKLESES